MRYYDIQVAGMQEWSSRLNGEHNPGALQVEFSLEVLHHAPVRTGNSTLTIHGIPWELITEAYNFAGKPIAIYGGMAPGLPLATFQSRTAGLLMTGSILKCWGNWIGTEMSLGFSFVPAGQYQANVPSGGNIPGFGPGFTGFGGGSTVSTSGTRTQSFIYNRVGPRSIDLKAPRISTAAAPVANPSPITVGGILASPMPTFGAATAEIGGVINSLFGGGGGGLSLIKPVNLIHNMQPGQTLASAMQETLSRAFPQAKTVVQISPNIKLGYQDSGVYQSVDQYSQYVHKLSQSVLGTDGYLGVQISSKDNTIHVWDGTSPVSDCNVDALDLIGQPTWVDWFTVSVKTVMRADLDVGGVIYLPPTLYTLTAAGAPMAGMSIQRTNDSFSGPFIIKRIVHIGDFRSPDSANWSTNIEAWAPQPPGDPTETSAD